MARTSSPRTWAVRIAAVATALLTAKVVATNLATIDAHANRLGSEISVVVARHDLALGARIGPDDLRTVQRHRSQVPADAITSAKAAIAGIVRMPVLADAVLQSGHIVANRTSAAGRVVTASAAVPPGFRVIRVVDNGGLVPEAGAIVDVLMVAESTPRVIPPDTESEQPPDLAAEIGSSPVIAEGAVVLAESIAGSGEPRSANNAAGSNPVRNAPRSRTSTDGTGIVLLVRTQEARAIATALAYGGVTIVLAPPEDACCATPSVP